MRRFNLLILLSILSASCSMFDHRDHYEQMGMADDGPMFKPNHDFMVVAGDSGRDYRSVEDINARTPLSEKGTLEYLEDQSLKKEVIYLENKLSNSQYDKYLKVRDEFNTPSEQIYYLRLSERERSDYVDSRKATGLGDRVAYSHNQDLYPQSSSVGRAPASIGGDIQAAFGAQAQEKQVFMGMGMEDVANTWGAPERRDIAGNPELMNERWAYHENGETKYIYFEGGRVEGWSFDSSQF